MTKRLFASMLMLIATVFTVGTLVSCSDKEDTPTTSIITLQVPMPADLTDAALEQAEATLVNIQTGKTYKIDKFEKNGEIYTAGIPVETGFYNVEITGTITHKVNGTTQRKSIRASQNNVKVDGEIQNNVSRLLPEVYVAQEGFIISEIFFAQTKTAAGKAYSFGQYIRITNNSSKTLYADSLAIIQSADISSLKHDYVDNFITDSVFAGSVFLIPGTGKSVPVEAGKSLILALNAKDHTTFAPGAPDLSKADFEFFDVSSNSYKDEDNHAVPNLDRWFSKSASITILHTGGVETYALARMQESKDDFLKNNFKDAIYKFKSGSFEKDMHAKGYLVPNSWIIDAVNLGMKNNYAWSIISPKLDAGFTYCLETQRDEKGYGLAVIRKMENGRYVDTNNSTNDFLPLQKPTLVK